MENGVNYEYVGGIMKSYDGLVLNIKGSEYKIELSEYTDITKENKPTPLGVGINF